MGLSPALALWLAAISKAKAAIDRVDIVAPLVRNCTATSDTAIKFH